MSTATEFAGLQMLAQQTAAMARMHWRYPAAVSNYHHSKKASLDARPYFSNVQVNQVEFIVRDISMTYQYNPDIKYRRRVSR